MKRTILLLLWAVVAEWPLGGADLPPLVFPEGTGVNIHFTRGHKRDLDLIAAAGIKFIRMDFTWAAIERRKGEFIWSDYDELTANLEQRGLRALYILDYSNRLYEETVVSINPVTGREQRDVASPQHPESVAAFARWAGAAAKHFAGRRIIWEIWNEPNISFWKPKPDAQQYNALAAATVKAIRANDPEATIVGPATSEVPQKFLEAFLSSEAPMELDAVSVHPYRPHKKPPETATEDYARLRALIAKCAPAPKKKILPILSGEWGYSTFAGGGISLERQAAYVVRQHIIDLLNRVPISIWYDWKNGGANPDEREENFGIVDHNLAAKPAYLALQTLTRELSGFRIEYRLPTQNERDYLILLMKGTERKLAAWTTAEPHAVKVGIGGVKRVEAVHGDGSQAEVSIHAALLSLTLRELPQYVTLNP